MSGTGYGCEVLADSITTYGVRAVTFEVTFPRFILAEVNTHRMLSRNSASSRAIPPELQIQRVLDSPFVPETFNRRVKGMGVGEPIEDQYRARRAWLTAAASACREASKLLELDCDKSRINRLLEPFLWHTAIITGTEWSNFLALRTDEGAQPEFRVIASKMLNAYCASSPYQRIDSWHLPLVSEDERGLYSVPTLKDLSARRCARVSFDKHADDEPVEVSLEKVRPLKANGHVSPFEHQLRPLTFDDLTLVGRREKLRVDLADAYCHDDVRSQPLQRVWCGNVRGFWQHRKELPNEDDFAKVR